MRWGAGVVGGTLGGFLLYLLVSLLTTAPQPWAGVVGGLALGSWFARSGAMAWARVWAVVAAGCFTLPPAALVAVARVGARAQRGGGPLDSALGRAGALLTGSAGVAAVVLGVPFALLAYLAFRVARMPAGRGA